MAKDGKVTILLGEDLHQAIQEKAREEGISVAAAIRQACEAWLQQGDGKNASIVPALLEEIQEKNDQIARLQEDAAQKNVLLLKLTQQLEQLRSLPPPREGFFARLRSRFR